MTRRQALSTVGVALVVVVVGYLFLGAWLSVMGPVR